MKISNSNCENCVEVTFELGALEQGTSFKHGRNVYLVLNHTTPSFMSVFNVTETKQEQIRFRLNNSIVEGKMKTYLENSLLISCVGRKKFSF